MVFCGKKAKPPQKAALKLSTVHKLVMCYIVPINVQVHFGVIMDAISYTAARANLASTMADVCNDHAPVIITRKSEDPVVMMSLEDYNSMQETTYLLRSPANARELLESIAELESGKGTDRELFE